MKRYAHWFDSSSPSKAEILGRYSGRLRDLREYQGLTIGNVAEAVIDISDDWRGDKEYDGLILPEMELWDPSSTVRVYRRQGEPIHRIRMSTKLRFNKFGPHVDLFSSRKSKRELIEEQATPRGLIRARFTDPDIRKRLTTTAYRGIGYWDPDSNQHVNVPFISLVEGEKYYNFFYKGMRNLYGISELEDQPELNISFQRGDAYVVVPSKSGGIPYPSAIKILPVTKGECFAEWAKTKPVHACKDSFFRTSNATDTEGSSNNRYRNDERTECLHTVGMRRAVEERSNRGQYPLLIRWPTPTGIVGPWFILRTKTLMEQNNKPERLSKTQYNIITGALYGMDVENMLDLDEDLSQAA